MNHLRRLFPPLALGLLAVLTVSARASEPSPATTGHAKVTVTRTPIKRLDFEVVVPATVDQVWTAFTTAAGVETWCAPKARVHLELGGDWEVGFEGAAPGGGTILSWLPNEMLAIHAMAPESFPTVRRERTIAVFRFEPVGDTQTRVRLAQFGWKEGKEWDQAFEYLAKGNEALLNMLYKRFADGPFDWNTLFKKPGDTKTPGSR